MTDTAPAAASLSHGNRKPLVTLALFAYNQEKFIDRAVQGALAQNYAHLEIILSDDCSSDSTFERMQAQVNEYRGPHEIRLRRNASNRGLGEHVNEVFAESRGEIVVMAAGDDISEPERCARSVELLERFPHAGEVLVSADVIDAHGNTLGENRVSKTAVRLQTLPDLFAFRHRVFGAGRAIRRSVFDRFGPLIQKCPTEDTPFLLRSLLCGGSVLTNQKLVKYRTHGLNLSSANSMSNMDVGKIHAQYLDDMRLAQALGWVSMSTVEKLQYWMEQDSIMRGIRLKLSSGDRLNARELALAIRSPMFGAKSKGKSLMQFLFFGRR